MTNRTAQRKRSSAKAHTKAASRNGRRGPRGRRSSSTRYRLAAVGAVVVVVLVMVVLSVSNHEQAPPTPGTSGAGTVIAAVTSVPASALDAVGAGEGISSPARIAAGAPAVTLDGKPEVLYIGAEYCPFCASERWPTVIALSRFGTFSGLGLTTSSSTDVFPSTPTLTFHGATYSSDLISFVGVEMNTNQLTASGLGYEPLDTLTPEQLQLMQTYDVPPYTSQSGSIPFVLIGNRFAIAGSSYPPDVLQGKTWEQIASALSDPSSAIAKQVLAAANVVTASICELTSGQPTSVCTAPGVTSAAALLPSA
jgi:hypothetical protein